MFHNPALLLLFFIKRAKPHILRTLLSVTSWEKDYTATESYDQNGVRTKRVEKYKDRTRTWGILKWEKAQIHKQNLRRSRNSTI